MLGEASDEVHSMPPTPTPPPPPPPVSAPPSQIHSPSAATWFAKTPSASTTASLRDYLEQVGHLAGANQRDAWLPITESRDGNAYYSAFHVLSSGIGFQALVLPVAFTILGCRNSAFSAFIGCNTPEGDSSVSHVSSALAPPPAQVALGLRRSSGIVTPVTNAIMGLSATSSTGTTSPTSVSFLPHLGEQRFPSWVAPPAAAEDDSCIRGIYQSN